MKFLISILTVTLFLTSCKNEEDKQRRAEWNENQKDLEKSQKFLDSLEQTVDFDTIVPEQTEWRVGKFSKYLVTEIDSCEYLYDDNYNLSVPGNLIHKGNCKNDFHRRRHF